MYIFIEKKNKGCEYLPLPVLLEELYNRLGKQSFAYCLPGYMSKKDSEIKKFLGNFPWSKQHNNAFFQSGMNGWDCATPSKDKIVNSYNQVTCNNSFQGYLSSVKKADHSKAIFFFSEPFPEQEPIAQECKQSIIEHLKHLKQQHPKAVLIGSSNQSNLTYYGIPANKGETDVLLVLDCVFNSGNPSNNSGNPSNNSGNPSNNSGNPSNDKQAISFNDEINQQLRKGNDTYSKFAFSVLSKEISNPSSNVINVIQDSWEHYLDELSQNL